MEIIQIAIAIVIVLIVGLPIGVFMLKIGYDYRITDSGIKVTLFGMKQIMFIHFHSIEETQKLTVKEYFSSWLRNRETFFAPINRLWGPAILIIRKGILKKILITPDNVDEYLKAISENNIN